jgi:cyclopropane-fatty-acyl-phospholipid synthase
VAAYRGLFERCHAWLRPGGSMALQTVAWGNTRPEDSSLFIETQIFPESDLPTLVELARA